VPTTLAAALVVCEKIQAAGARATTDPAALNPPAVLVPPPRRLYDVGCGYTAQWGVHAIAAGPTGGDRTTWAQLDDLVDAVAAAFAVEVAQPGAYVIGPNTHPSYLITFTTPEE
jgi:nucleoside-diphosphate-sugar epimerase